MTTQSSAVTAAVVAALVTLLSSSISAGVQVDAPDPEAVIRALERALTEGMHARDRGRLEQLLAPDYVLRGAPDVDRETWLRNALTMCWGDRSDIDAFRARRHGDVVVASFELTFHMDPATCRPGTLRSLITDVWVQQTDGWRLQIRHSGPPPRADAGIASQYGIVPEPPPAWEVISELSLVATGGNTSTRTIGLGANVTHRTEVTRSRAQVAFLTSEVDAVTRARSFTMQARHGIRVGRRVELFGDASYGRDRFAGIDDRATTTAGVAYTALVPPRHALTAEGSIGFTAEQRLDATNLRFATAASGVRYAWTVVPGTQLTEDIALNADLESAENWRGTNAMAITVALTRLLSLKASHALEYRNRPVAGFGRMDTRTSAALLFSLRRRPGTR